MCSTSNHNIEFGKTLKAVLQARRAGLRVIQHDLNRVDVKDLSATA